MPVRVDKWLQIARVFRTRSKATKACTSSRVRINGHTAKPHRNLAIGDRIEVDLRDWTRVLVVRELRDKPLPKSEAPRLYDDESPPKPTPDPWARMLRQRPAQREAGSGRPTKKERREIERWRRG